MSNTPRMKAAQMAAMEHGTGDVWRVGCDIERELNEANLEVERLTQKVVDLSEGAKEQNQRIRQLIAERDTARLQADQKVSLRYEFCQMLGTDELKEGVDVVKAMKARITHLEDRIERASKRFFFDGSDRQTAVAMLAILEEERTKP